MPCFMLQLLYLCHVYSTTKQWGLLQLNIKTLTEQFLKDNFDNKYEVNSIQIAKSCDIIRNFQKYQIKTPS